MRTTPPASPTSIEVDPPFGDGPAADPADVDAAGRGGGARTSAAPVPDGLWFALAALLRGRWIVLGISVLVAVSAVAISLRLPNWYAASVRVLPPESSGANPLTAALLRNAGSAASAFLGGPSSDYARYLAILSSRRVLEGLVDEFDLVAVYDVQDEPAPRAEALRILEENISFPVDEDFEFLSVVVLDRSPRRAAAMANSAVVRLNEVNTELSSSNAATYRQFVQRRYDEAQLALDSVLTAGQAFQRRYGIMDLGVQTQAYFSQLAELRGQATAAEIQAEALSAQYGPENEEVQMMQGVADAANTKISEMMAGSEATLPVAQSDMSNVARQYVDLQREAAVQGQILEVVMPLIEQARFEEEKQVEAVQVVDAAVPSAHKAKPRRAIIVATATLSGFLLSCLFVVALATWQRNAGHVSERLRAAAGR